MNDREETRKIVLRVLEKIAPEAALGEVDPKTPFQDQLDLDSMDFLNFVAGLTEETGVEIPERDYPKVATLEGCVAYVDTALSAAATAVGA